MSTFSRRSGWIKAIVRWKRARSYRTECCVPRWMRGTRQTRAKLFATLLVVGLFGSSDRLWSADWPHWMGPNRDGTWRESGIIESSAGAMANVGWRKTIGAGTVRAGKYLGNQLVTGRLDDVLRDHQRPHALHATARLVGIRR